MPFGMTSTAPDKTGQTSERAAMHAWPFFQNPGVSQHGGPKLSKLLAILVGETNGFGKHAFDPTSNSLHMFKLEALFPYINFFG